MRFKRKKMQNPTKFFSTAWLGGPSFWLTFHCIFSTTAWSVVAWITFVLKLLMYFEVHFCTIKKPIFQNRLVTFF